MRILHVYKDYPPVLGGIEGHVHTLATTQAAAGHSVTVLVTGPNRRTVTRVEEGVRVIRAARLATMASTPISPALAFRLARETADVTHVHLPYPVAEAAWLLAGMRPLVVTYHSDVVRQRTLGRLWSPWLTRILSEADRILATSQSYVNSSPFLARQAGKVAIVPLGVRPERFQVERTMARKRFGDGPTILFVGRLRYYKGLDVLLAALASLPEGRLLVAGGGPMEDAWHHEARALSIQDRVVWLGEVSDADLPVIYAASDVFVLPAVARSEAFGVVQLEAMAAGLPVVTTEVGSGTSWVTQAGETGLIVPPGDPVALAEAIAGLLADADRRTRMGEAGRRRVSELFTEEKMLDQVAEIYAQVVAMRAHRDPRPDAERFLPAPGEQ